MGPVRTAFFTRCWRSIPTSRWLLGALALCLAVMAVEPAHGNTRVDLIELRVERGDDGLYLSYSKNELLGEKKFIQIN